MTSPFTPLSRPGWRRVAAVAGTAVLAAGGLVAATGGPAPAQPPACRVDYAGGEWTTGPGQGGFFANLTITNLAAPLANWHLTFTFPDGQRLTGGWSAQWSQHDARVDATSLPWNGPLATGQSVVIGLTGVWAGGNTAPDDFVLNGVPCNQPGPDDPDPVTNPYEDAQVYVNPEWAAQVLSQAASTPGALGAQMAQVATYPTAVWLDEIATISDGHSLVDHLDEALLQGADLVQLVVYNLPGRDCAGRAVDGELPAGSLDRYRTEFIDPIVEILGRPEYADLRVVAIVEPDALAALVTETRPGLPNLECQEVLLTGDYVEGVRYALDQLNTLPHVYSYLDMSHAGLLGYPDNLLPTATLAAEVVAGTGGPGFDSVAGFVTNLGNYVATVEPFLPDPDLVVGGFPIWQGGFFDWNRHFSATSYARAAHAALVEEGFPDRIGVLIDTGRNGWGGPDRPTQVSTSTNPEVYVDESRVDRRPGRYAWCNQVGAGIGERPTAAPAEDIHAYVWVKPPGESDGVADPLAAPDPQRPHVQHRDMCNPEGNNHSGGLRPTNAMPGAPHAGVWFPELFAQLVANAHPPIS
jgi:cellulose 1,4-beta-cellobiosidase